MALDPGPDGAPNLKVSNSGSYLVRAEEGPAAITLNLLFTPADIAHKRYYHEALKLYPSYFFEAVGVTVVRGDTDGASILP